MTGHTPPTTLHRAVPPGLHVLHTTMRAANHKTCCTESAANMRPTECQTNALPVRPLRGMNIHKNISVSVTKLTLGFRVDFISSHLTVGKLFPVKPRAITGPPKMSLLLEAKSVHACIDLKPRLILVTRMDDLGLYITSNQQGRCSFKTIAHEDYQQAKCYARADPVFRDRQNSN